MIVQIGARQVDGVSFELVESETGKMSSRSLNMSLELKSCEAK